MLNLDHHATILCYDQSTSPFPLSHHAHCGPAAWRIFIRISKSFGLKEFLKHGERICNRTPELTFRHLNLDTCLLCRLTTSPSRSLSITLVYFGATRLAWFDLRAYVELELLLDHNHVHWASQQRLLFKQAAQMSKGSQPAEFDAGHPGLWKWKRQQHACPILGRLIGGICAVHIRLCYICPWL